MVKLEIIGNLTADPVIREIEYTVKETGEITKAKVCSFTVAANEGFGPYKTTTYFKVNAWRSLGEACMKTLKKGRGVFAVGPVTQNNYIDKNNNMRSGMEIRASEVLFLSDGRKIVSTNDVDVIEGSFDDDVPY